MWFLEKILFTLFFFKFIYLGGEGQREERENYKPNVGLESMNHEIMTWAKIKSQMLTAMLTEPPSCCFKILFIFIFYFSKVFNIYFWERERAREQAIGRNRERERERETESKAGSRVWAIHPEPTVGLELTNLEIMTWAEVGHTTDWATQASPKILFLSNVYTHRRARTTVLRSRVTCSTDCQPGAPSISLKVAR